MSVALLVTACVVAIANLPVSAGMFAWGLAGGDGEPQHWSHTVLAGALILGAVLSVAYSFGAFEGISLLRWQLMWVAPCAALIAIVVLWAQGKEKPLDAVKALWSPAALAIPPGLVWIAGAVQA